MDMRKAKRIIRIGMKNLRVREDIGGWNKKAVVGVRDDGAYIYFESATKAAQALGLQRRNISLCCEKKRSKCGAFRWFFFEDDEWANLVKCIIMMRHE